MVDSGFDRWEVGEGAAKPALVNVEGNGGKVSAESARRRQQAQRRKSRSPEEHLTYWLSGLADCAELLVASGHDLDKVFQLPMRRLLALVQLAEKRLGREQAQFIVGVRAAVWSDKKAFKALLKELDDG